MSERDVCSESLIYKPDIALLLVIARTLNTGGS